MQRIRSIKALNNYREKLLQSQKHNQTRVIICGGTGCRANGSLNVAKAFTQELKKQKLTAKVEIKLSGCHGFCQQGPLLVIEPEGIFYRAVSCDNNNKDVREIIQKTIKKGIIVERLLYEDPQNKRKIANYKDIPFYSRQMRIALRNNGKIDPNSIEDYISVDGYSALGKVLETAPADVITTIKKSGLRGRGGGGFPTGLKWEFCRNAKELSFRYIICNADEGDPGAFMDRSIMEGDPHSVLEGMAIGAYAMSKGICPVEGYIYIRAEYPLAVNNVRIAIQQAKQYGLLGDNIMGTGFSFHIKVKEGAGAFVCGEETALMTSIEGNRGMPRPRPPFPANKGLFGKPTNINNVETWANISSIINKGSTWYASIGTKESKGTKVFSLVGKVKNSGLVEVPMGISLREIVFDIGGGILDNKKIKAVQTGGPSGGCIPAELLDMPVDYEALAKVGSIMGSGGMVVLDEDSCMVDIARYFVEFTRAESCGKCTPCRIGTAEMLSILERITAGEGKPEDIDLLIEIGNGIKATALCGLGQTAPNPVLTTLQYFRHEYEEHIEQHKCRAVVCKKIVEAPCKHTCPANVDVPRYIRYIGKKRYKDAYNVVREKIPFPFVCGRVCFHPCETKCRRGQIDDPIAIRALKRVATDLGGPARKIPAAKKRGKRIAIIGSGPCGLSAGYYLQLLGHRVTVFEALSRAGGMMWTGIPDYRLPAKVLQKEIDSLGLTIKLNAPVKSVEELAKKYDAVVIATGAHKGINLRIPGEDVDGVIDCVDFLRKANSNKKAKIGSQVIVIGGGNAAIDAARAALRQGAKQVSIVYRRSEEQMPATEDEIEEARKEKIQIRILAAPVSIEKHDSRLRMTFQNMKLGPVDTSGRPKPVPIEGSTFFIDTDTVIPAIGQRPTFPKTAPRNVSKWGTIDVNEKTNMTKSKGIFAGGDVVLGPSSVIESIAEGRKLASQIDRHFGGDGNIEQVFAPAEDKTNLKVIEPEGTAARVRIPSIAVKKRSPKREVELCLSQSAAIKETKRCLNCDLEE